MTVRSTLASLLASLAALSAGCKQDVLCPSLGACGGGAPVGVNGHTDATWVLAPGHPSCSEDLYVPAVDTRLAMQGGTLTTGMPAPEPAVFDWCVLLVTGPGAGQDIEVAEPRFYYGEGPIGFATLKFGMDGHFSSGITRTGTFILDFPAYCMRAFGAMPGPLDPTDPNSPVVDVCTRLQVPLRQRGVNTGAYQNSVCDANTPELRAQLGLDGAADPNGCLCRFDLDETGGPAGTYVMEPDSTILDFPDSVNSNYPQRTTYCLQGDNLKLTGADGAYLFDQRGLRTLDLVRVCHDNTECASNNCANIDPVKGTGLCQ
ncbi:MAG TPA: hypothetical protein VHL80_18040 [Polyangia bacterium]|nr:hypothetical protein [Polyangia bacterium]